MKNLKVIFMGTPDFCVPILKKLNELTNVILVVTQPDKEVGRKKEIVFSPIKKCAIDLGIDIFQPVKIKEDYEKIVSLNADIIITCAYGQIIPEAILSNPRLGCINVHASLLPKLRGGAPIHKAIIDGYNKTGITIMYMDKGMDTGDIISKKEVLIGIEDTAETLHDKLQKISVELLVETLPSIINKTNVRIKQESNLATYAYNISREEEHIDFDNNSLNIYNRIRGLNSWPGAYAKLNNKDIKIWASKIIEKKYDEIPGTIISIDKNGILVSTKDKSILLTEIQIEGKRKMFVKDFVNGIDVNDYILQVFK